MTEYPFSQEQQRNIFCPYCGKDNIQGSVFCRGCGQRLPRLEPPSAGTAEAGASVASAGKKQGKKRSALPGILLSILVVAALAAAAYLLIPRFAPWARKQPENYLRTEKAKLSYRDIHISDGVRELTVLNAEGEVLQPFEYEDETYVPIDSAIFLDYVPAWSEETGIVTMAKAAEEPGLAETWERPAEYVPRTDTESVSVALYRLSLVIDGKPYVPEDDLSDLPMVVIENNVYISIRVFALVFPDAVDWNAGTNTIVLIPEWHGDVPDGGGEIAPEQAIQTEERGEGQKIVPDLSALDGIAYAGERRNCKMSPEMALSYAEAIEGLPEKRSVLTGGAEWKLAAVLVDPVDDGMPYLMMAYRGDRITYVKGEAYEASLDGTDHFQLWTWDGVTAARYPFEKDLVDRGIFGAEFGSLDGVPALRVGDGVGNAYGLCGGTLYYTLGGAKLNLIHHYMGYTATSEDGIIASGEKLPLVAPLEIGEYFQKAYVSELLKNGWTQEPWDGYYYFLQLLDGAIFPSDRDWYSEHIFTAKTFSEEWTDGSDWITFSSTGEEYLIGPWSSGKEMASALRAYAAGTFGDGQPPAAPPAGNPTVQILTDDRSGSVDGPNGLIEYDFYYEYALLPDSVKNAEKINAEILREKEQFFENAGDRNPRKHLEEAVAQNAYAVMVGHNCVDVSSVFLSDRYFSVNLINTSWFGGSDGCYYLGYTFDLQTGEKVLLPELLGKPLDEAKRQVYHNAAGGTEDDTVRMRILECGAEELTYCIKEDGSVYMLFGKYTFAGGPKYGEFFLTNTAEVGEKRFGYTHLYSDPHW